MVGRTQYGFDGEADLFTGSTKGIGLGIAEAFIEAGANVDLNSQSDDLVVAPVDELSEGATGEVIGVTGDVEDEKGLDTIVETATDRFGTIDVLFNNAEMWPRGSMVEASLADWDQTMVVNVRSQFYLSKLVAQTIIDNDVSGSIVNITCQTGDR